MNVWLQKREEMMAAKMLKVCELCEMARATMHCESDEARLCWSCDASVHSANFLVARHVRTLLCHVCHSHTCWTASGSAPCPTISLCNTCLMNTRNSASADEEEDNQVVPFASVAPPPVSSSSSSEQDEEDEDLCRSQGDDIGCACCTSRASTTDEEVNFTGRSASKKRKHDFLEMDGGLIGRIQKPQSHDRSLMMAVSKHDNCG